MKLLQFIYHYTTEYNEGLSINAIIFYRNYSKNHLLKLINHLYDFDWITKKRDPLDQRRLIICLSHEQCENIISMLEDFKSFLRLKAKSVEYLNQFSVLPYYYNCHEQFETIKHEISQNHLSLEELYILGLLIINNKQTTFKNIKAHNLRGLVTMSPIIKKLYDKGYVNKSRSSKDERNIVLSVNEDKVPYIKTTIEECYNSLETGISKI